MFQTRAHIPRNAFSLRDAPRAGDLWRAFQEVAVEASSAAGWPPKRYRDEKTAFVVRSMHVRHALEPYYGEALEGRTWVSRMRRDIFSTREVRIQSVSRGLIATARQEWVHVSENMAPARAPQTLLEAFPVEAHGAAESNFESEVNFDATSPVTASMMYRMQLEAWWTWMDPLDHANHPAYVDWCDEALCRAIAASGGNPLELVPVAEDVTFRVGVRGGQRVEVRTELRGISPEGHLAFSHRIVILHPDREEVAATASTLRRLVKPEGTAQLHAFFAERSA